MALKYFSVFKGFVRENPFTILARNFGGGLEDSFLVKQGTKLNVVRPSLSYQEKKLLEEKQGIISAKDNQQFRAMFPLLFDNLLQHDDLGAIHEFCKRFIDHTVFNGNCKRGLTVVSTYRGLENPEKLTLENIHLANILGWCNELLYQVIVITDDLIDKSNYRHGVPCWYKCEGVGKNTIVHAYFIEHYIYAILKEHFSGHPIYLPTVELFQEIFLNTAKGQAFDCMFQKNGKPQLHLFTKISYKALVKYKSTLFVAHIPITLAFYLTGRFDNKLHEQVAEVTTKLGEMLQVRNDFEDCFALVPGRDSRDIVEGKCTWLVTTALEQSTSSQKKLIDKHYGRDVPESEEIIRNLYEDLNIPDLYAEYVKSSIDAINQLTKRLPKGINEDVFLELWEKVIL